MLLKPTAYGGLLMLFYLVKLHQEAAIGRGFYRHPAFFKGFFELFLRVLASRFFAVFHKTSLELMKKKRFLEKNM